MQGAVTRPRVTLDELAEAVGRDAADVKPVVTGLVGAKYARWEGQEDERGEVEELWVTEHGRWQLQGWWHEDEREAALGQPTRSSARLTFPLAVFGSSCAKSTIRGYL